MSVVTLQIGQCGNQLGHDLYNVLAQNVLDGSSNIASDMFFRQDSHGKYTPRALLLDMEPKVVNQCIYTTNRPATQWAYDSANAVVQQSGSGARCPTTTQNRLRSNTASYNSTASTMHASYIAHMLNVCRGPVVRSPEMVKHTARLLHDLQRLAGSAGNNWALGYHLHGGRCTEAVMQRARRQAERCDHFAGFLLLQSLAGGTGAGFGSRIAQELCDYMPSSLRLSCAVWPYESGEVIVQVRSQC